VLPGVPALVEALVEPREDLVLALDRLAFAADEDGNLVGADVLAHRLPVLRLGLDLLREELDAELRQLLPDLARVRAPLRLVERQHALLVPAAAADITRIRTFGYIVAGWFLLGFALNGAYAVSGAGVFVAVLGVAGIAWLIRSYRQGPRPEPSDPRLARLAAAFPHDPLQNDEIVDAWGAHVHDADALARLRASYERTRRGLTAGNVDEAEDYLRSVRLLAGEAPELVDRALEEHGRAQRALETGDEAPTAALLAADARLQGARDALRKDEERPLDALRLATEAERLAAVSRELASAAAEADDLRDAVAAATERHPDSALAEVRGLPALVREEVERARTLAANEDIDEALHALARAREYARRITAHVERLEQAAATGRDRLHAAEAAVDAAPAETMDRARELLSQARSELEAERPNWLEIVALAERALLLTRETPRVDDDVEAARRRAREARDEALAWSLTGSRRAAEMLPLAAASDDAYHEAEGIADAGLALAEFQRAEALARKALARLASEDDAEKSGWNGEFTLRWRGDLSG
jgi:hypothetical protein